LDRAYHSLVTTNAGRLLAGLLFLAAATADARPMDLFDHAAVMESLSSVHPRLRGRWLTERGLELPGWNAPMLPMAGDSGRLRLVGKWGRGTAVEVTGKDSLVFLSLGSEVAIVNFSVPDSPRVLAEVQAAGLVSNAEVRDTILFVGNRTYQSGIDAWDISDPANPVLCGHTPTLLSTFCVVDTFALIAQRLGGGRDSFKVYSTADPSNLRLLGWSRDSGDMVVASGTKALVTGWRSVGIIDFSDPTHPRRVGNIAIDGIGVDIRGNLCAVVKWWNGDDDYFWVDMVDISNPAAPRVLGEAAGVGGYDLHLSGPLLFASGFQSGGFGFAILDVSDSTRPRVISECATPGARQAVWADWTANHAYVADRSGLSVIDISNLNSPRLDTNLLNAGVYATDVSVRGSIAAVTAAAGELHLLDVSAPSAPVTLYAGRGLGECSAEVSDSVVYVDANDVINLRVLSIRDPAHPLELGGTALYNGAEDMVAKDSFLYVTEYARFQVVNVARPWAPVVVGTCTTTDGYYWGMKLQGTLAFLNSWDGLTIVDVSSPRTPRVVSQTSSPHGRVASEGLAVHDSLVFIASCYETLWVFSVADPQSPTVVAGAPLGTGGWGYDADMLDDSTVVAGCRAFVRLVDVSDPTMPVATDLYPMPYFVRRITCVPPYIYAALFDGGVCILEASPAGLADAQPRRAREQFQIWPNPTRGKVKLRAAVRGWRVVDVTGRVVMAGRGQNGKDELSIDLRRQPPGVYCVEAVTSGGVQRSKVVRTE
jgi:hypothetical protein